MTTPTNNPAGLLPVEQARAITAEILGFKDWSDATDYRNSGHQDAERDRIFAIVSTLLAATPNAQNSDERAKWRGPTYEWSYTWGPVEYRMGIENAAQAVVDYCREMNRLGKKATFSDVVPLIRKLREPEAIASALGDRSPPAPTLAGQGAVAWMYSPKDGSHGGHVTCKRWKDDGEPITDHWTETPLYASPPADLSAQLVEVLAHELREQSRFPSGGPRISLELAQSIARAALAAAKGAGA